MPKQEQALGFDGILESKCCLKPEHRACSQHPSRTNPNTAESMVKTRAPYPTKPPDQAGYIPWTVPT
jgi:hypothetical protein